VLAGDNQMKAITTATTNTELELLKTSIYQSETLTSQSTVSVLVCRTSGPRR